MICRRFLYNHMHVFFLQGGYLFIRQCFAHGLVMKRTEAEAKHYRIFLLGWTIWNFGEDMYVYDCFLIHFFFFDNIFFCFMVLSLLLTIFSFHVVSVADSNGAF